MYIVLVQQHLVVVGNIVLLYFEKNNYGIAYKINLFFKDIPVTLTRNFRTHMLTKVSENLYNMFIINLYMPYITLVDIIEPQNIKSFRVFKFTISKFPYYQKIDSTIISKFSV